MILTMEWLAASWFFILSDSTAAKPADYHGLNDFL
jgi:hypothetical protein